MAQLRPPRQHHTIFIDDDGALTSSQIHRPRPAPTWHSLPNEMVIKVCEKLSLIDLFAIHHLNEQCANAAQYHFRQRCHDLTISRTIIENLFANGAYDMHCIELIAVLLSQVGDHVCQLTVDFMEPWWNAATSPDESSKQDAAEFDYMLITHIVLRLCPDLRQYRLIGPHRSDTRKIVRIFTAPFDHQSEWIETREEFAPLVDRILDSVTAINRRNDSIVRRTLEADWSERDSSVDFEVYDLTMLFGE